MESRVNLSGFRVKMPSSNDRQPAVRRPAHMPQAKPKIAKFIAEGEARNARKNQPEKEGGMARAC